MLKQEVFYKLISIFLFIIILIVGFQYSDDVCKLLGSTQLNWLLIGIFFYFCNYLTRAYRLQFLVSRHRLPFPLGLKTASLHGCYSYFLPFRSGDVSLPFLLKRYIYLPLASGGGILVRARLLDMVSLGILLAFSSLLSYQKLDIKIFFAFLVASILLIGVPFLIELIIRKGRWPQVKWVKTFSGSIKHNPMGLKEIALSLLVWFWIGCTLFSVTKSLDIPIEFMDIWFLVAIQLPLQLLPIQGVANAGNHEAGWVTGFTLLGISYEQGIGFAVASHVIIIVYVLVLGLAGFLIPLNNNT